ncbi:MAG TPA: hypothetical protein VGH28_32585 [Polyangiaceae bacterium]
MFRHAWAAAPVFLFASSALAQDRVIDPNAEASKDVSRPWLYNDDPTIPSPLHVVASLGDTYSGNDRSVSRAFASHDDGPGGKANATVQVGVVKMFAVDVTGVLGGFGDSVAGGVMAGARFAPFDMAKHGFRLAIAAGYLLDLDSASGFYGRVTASLDVGRVRFAAMVHGEHVARTGGDPVDLFVTAGTSVKLAPVFRLGVEYIAQDIEEAFASSKTIGDDDDGPGRAEGGVHQFVGLTGTFELLRHRLFIDLGPALAFRPEIGQVAPVGRALVSYSF